MSTQIVVELVLAVVLVILLVIGLLVLRRLQILRRGGVEASLREARPADDLQGWRSGLGRYRGDEFRWYRVSGLSGAPNVIFDRTRVEIVDRRAPQPGELHAATSTVLRCRTPTGTWEIAIGADALTGFSSWLESTPPGRSTGYRQAS